MSGGNICLNSCGKAMYFTFTMNCNEIILSSGCDMCSLNFSPDTKETLWLSG